MAKSTLKDALRPLRTHEDDEYEEEALEDAGEDGLLDDRAEDDDEPMDDPISARLDRDIFKDMERKVAKGMLIEYRIKKNGKVLTTVEHPFSWGEIQRNFGAGHYRVAAVDGNRGVILSNQSETLLEAPEMRGSKKAVKGEILTAPAPSSNPVLEMLSLMREQSREDRLDADRRMREQRQESQKQTEFMLTLMTTMIQSLAPKSGGNDSDASKLLFEIMKSRMDDQSSLIRELTQELRKEGMSHAQAASTASAMAGDPLTFLKQIQDAEERGFTRFQKLQEMVRLESEDRLSLMAPSKGDEEKESKSMIQSLLENAIPALSDAFQARTVEKQTEAARGGAAQPGFRRSLSAPGPGVRRPNQGIKSSQGAPAQGAPGAPVVPNRRPHPGKAAQRAPLGVPTLQPLVKPEPKNVGAVVTPIRKETAPVNDTRVQALRNRIIGVIGPHLRKWIVGQADTKDCAARSLDALQMAGVSNADLLTAFPNEQSLLDYAKQNKIPKLAFSWLTKYYADLRSEASPQPRTNPKG